MVFMFLAVGLPLVADDKPETETEGKTNGNASEKQAAEIVEQLTGQFAEMATAAKVNEKQAKAILTIQTAMDKVLAKWDKTSEKKIAAFITKRSKLIDSITPEDFVKYKEAKDIKKLAKKYDAFIAVAPLMGKIATTFGRVFGPMNRMPSPQAGIIPKETDEMINMMVGKLKKSIRVKNKEMAIKLPIGKEDMKDDELKENIEAVIKGLKKVLPRGNDNVKEVLIKFTMTKPVKVA